MAKVLDAVTQQVVDVPDDEVTEYVSSGRGTLPRGEVHVFDPVGGAGTVPAENAAEFFRAGGRYRSAADVAEAKRREEFEDRPVAAGVAAAARGVTLGLSDVALTETGTVAPATLRGLEDYNEGASIAGEVVGTAAATLATAGAAAPAVLAERVGVRAGAALAESALVRGAVAGTIEGGLQGLGRAVTDAAQERDPLTAQKVLASGAQGALFGLAGGAVLGGLAGKGKKGAGRDAVELLEDEGDEAADAALDLVRPAPATALVSSGRVPPAPASTGGQVAPSAPPAVPLREVPSWVPKAPITPTGPAPDWVVQGGPSGRLNSVGGAAPPPAGVPLRQEALVPLPRKAGVYEVALDELDDISAHINGKRGAADELRRQYAKGVKSNEFDPIKVGTDAGDESNLKRTLVDGNHRLALARERGEKTIRVKFEDDESAGRFFNRPRSDDNYKGASAPMDSRQAAPPVVEAPPSIPPGGGAPPAVPSTAGAAGGSPPGAPPAPPPSSPPGGGRPPGPPGEDMAERMAEEAGRFVQPVKRAIERNPGVFRRLFEALDFKFPDANEFILRGLDAKKADVGRLRKKNLQAAAPRSFREDPRFQQVRNQDDAARLVEVKFEEEGARVRRYAAELDNAIGEADQMDVMGFVDRARRELVERQSRGTIDERATASRISQELDALVERAEMLQAQRAAPRGADGVPVPTPPPARRPQPRGPDGRFLVGEQRAAAEAAAAAQAGQPAPPTLRLSFADGEDFKRALDPSIKHDAMTSNATREGLEALRGMFNRSQEEAAASVSARLNRDIFEQWKTAKVEFGRMAELKKITDSRLNDAKVANRLFSLTDNLAGMVGAVAGGGLNPVGLGMSLGAALLNKWGRENLPFVMARAMADYEGTPGARQAAQALWRRFRGGGGDAGASPLRDGGGPGGAPGGAGAASLDEEMEGMLRTAAQQGPEETWLAHSVLSGAVEYRAYAERAGFADFRAEADAEGVRRGRVMDRAAQAAQDFDAKAAKAASALVSGKRAASRSLPRESAEKRAEQVRKVVADPTAFVEGLATRMASVGARAPGLAEDIQDVAQRAQTFLAAKVPVRPVGPLGDIAALRNPWRASDVEMEAWGAYVRAVESPLSVIEDAAAGRLTRESVEALGAVYPELLADLQGRVVAQLAERRTPLPYVQRLSLGQVLGVQLDESMSPAFIASMQARYGEQVQNPPGRPSGGGASRRMDAEMTEAERVSQARA